MFESTPKLLLGLLTGIVFGFLLQKGQVAKYSVILGQLLLKNWTVAKIMATAIVVGSIGVYVMQSMGWVKLEIKPAAFGAVIGGAILFGIGMAVLGYCPGTTVAACGEGRRDAMVGLVGMILGAAAYVWSYGPLRNWATQFGDWGKVTVPQVTHTSPWLWIVILAMFLIAGALVLERHYSAKQPKHNTL